MEDIIGTILAARTLTQAEKEQMLEKFKDQSVTNEQLMTMLQQLADAEIALINEENHNLEKMRAENDSERSAEETRIQSDVDAETDAANEEASHVITDYARDLDILDSDLSKVCETIKRSETEADEMNAIKKQFGL